MHSRTFLPLALLAWVPAAAAAQRSANVTLFDPVVTRPALRCEPPARLEQGAWQRVLGALETAATDSAVAALLALEDSLGAELDTRPDHVPLRYLIATSTAVRADIQGGGARVRAAGQLHRRLTELLVRDPDHAGAQHLMGRLHAGVMRLDRITRFVATRLLGGGALRSASWAEAERLLGAAAAGDPCVPDHHYELAQLYADTGRPDEAMQELERLLVLGASHRRHEIVMEKARRLAEDLSGRG